MHTTPRGAEDETRWSTPRRFFRRQVNELRPVVVSRIEGNARAPSTGLRGVFRGPTPSGEDYEESGRIESVPGPNALRQIAAGEMMAVPRGRP